MLFNATSYGREVRNQWNPLCKRFAKAAGGVGSTVGRPRQRTEPTHKLHPTWFYLLPIVFECMGKLPNRRQYLATLGTAGVAGLAGCSLGTLEAELEDDAEETTTDVTEETTTEVEPETFEEDFDYSEAELEENGWGLDGAFSIEESRLTADLRSNAFAATTIPSGFTGTWEFNGVQNNEAGRGLRVQFLVDLPEDDLDANADKYTLIVRQLPDGIGRDFEGNNVAVSRKAEGVEMTLIEPGYDHEGDVHDYTIETSGGQFRLFIDGDEVGAFEDESGLHQEVTHIRIRMDGPEQYVDEISQVR